MPEPITMYGATHCGDTFRVRRLLKSREIPFEEVNIDHDPDAEHFVRFINAGNRTTPTLVIGEGAWKTVLSEPDNLQVDEMLRRAGYLKDNTP
jgi:mycoredoxin